MNKWAQRGFTIIESILFLAVAGGVMVGGMVIILNRQRSIEFRQSVKQFEVDINDLINDTETGSFPTVDQVRCEYNEIDNKLIFIDDVTAIPGRNHDCLFLGKAIQFGDEDTPPAADGTYGVHTIIGSSDVQQGSFRGSPYITTLFNASTPFFDTYEGRELGWGLTIADAYYIHTDAANPTGQVRYIRGFVVAYGEFGELNSNGAFFGDFQSGSSRVSIFAIETDDAPYGQQMPRSGQPRQTQAQFRDFLTDPLNLIKIVDPQSDNTTNLESNNLVICLISQKTNRKAALTIGTEQGVPRAYSNFDIDSTGCSYE